MPGRRRDEASAGCNRRSRDEASADIHCRGRAGDSGVISLFVAVIFVAFLLVTGIVIDGAALRGQRRALSDVARQAARAAVQEVDVTLYRSTGLVRLQVAEAGVAARAVVEGAGYESEVTVWSDRASVRASSEVPVRVLGLGSTHVRVSAEHEARAVWGVSRGR